MKKGKTIFGRNITTDFQNYLFLRENFATYIFKNNETSQFPSLRSVCMSDGNHVKKIYHMLKGSRPSISAIVCSILSVVCCVESW